MWEIARHGGWTAILISPVVLKTVLCMWGFTLKMEAAWISKMLISYHITTQKTTMWIYACIVRTSVSSCWKIVSGSRKQNHFYECLQDEDFHHHWCFPNAVWSLPQSVEFHVS